jgi:hypothetical protein
VCQALREVRMAGIALGGHENETVEDDENEERELTYEEIRQRNIARNEEFLNYLFPQGMVTKENDQNDSNRHLVSEDMETLDASRLWNRIKAKLPARTNEAMRIFEYLEQVG